MLKTKVVYQIIAGLIAGFCFFAAAEIGVPNYRMFVRPLTIQVDRNSPPYSAYEDSQLNFYQGSEVQRTLKSEKLIAGVKLIRRAGPKTFTQPTREFKALEIKLVEPKISPLSPKEQIAYEYMKENPEPKTVDQVAKELVASALLEKEVVEETGSPTRILASSGGGKILVQTPKAKGPSEPSKPGRSSSRSGPQTTEDPDRSINITLSTPKRYVLSGSLALHGGAAMIPGRDDIYIYHRVDYEPRSMASVNIKDASYRIDIDGAKGHIVAEVRNQSGVLIAKGERSLATIAKSVLQHGQIKNFEIKIKPAHSAFKIQVVDGSTYSAKPIVLSKAKVEIMDLARLVPFDKKNNIFMDDEVIVPSRVFVRATHPDFWPSLQAVRVGDENPIKLIKKKNVQALVESVLLRQDMRNLDRQGIIWGSVKYRGKPLNNAKISLLQGGGIKTHYFSGPLLDKNRQYTSQNGEFAIIGIEPGAHFLKVERAGKAYFPSVTFVKEGHLTKVDIDLTPKRIEIKAFDANTSEYVPGMIGFMENHNDYEIQGSSEQVFHWSLAKDISILQIDAGDEYVTSHTSATSDKADVVIPLVKEKWLDEALTHAKRVPREGQLYTAYGLVTGDNYVVSVPGLNEQAEVLYFNPDGSHRAEDFGVADGSYVVTGMAEGYHTLVILPEHSDKDVVAQPVWIVEGQPHTSFLSLEL